MKQKKKIVGIILFILIGYVLFGIFSFVGRHFMGYEYPDGSFLFFPFDRYMDFFNVNQMVFEGKPYTEYYSSYPPFALFIARFFSFFADYGTYTAAEIAETTAGRISYIVYVVFFTVLIGIYLYKILAENRKYFKNSAGLIFTLLCMIVTTPYIFILDRGNYLLVSIALFTAFIYYYDKDETAAAVCIGLAAAVKIYPLFFLLLYLVDKKWKSAGIMILSGGLSTLLSLFFFDGGLKQNIIEFGYALFNFGSGYANEAANVYFGVGLTSLLRFPFFLFHDGTSLERIPVMRIYLVVGTLLTLWSVWNLRREKCLWKKVLLLSVLMVFLSPNSYLYNLMYLVPGITLFMMADPSEKQWNDIIYFLLSGFILIPKAYYYISFEDAVSIQVALDGVTLLVFVLYYNIFDRSTRKNERSDESRYG